MERKMGNEAYKVGHDDLIYDASMPICVDIIEMDQTPGEVKAGMVIAADSSGKAFIYGESGKTASDLIAIANEDADLTGASGKVSFSAYKAACINGNRLITKNDQQISAGDLLKLQKNGIWVKYAIN